MTWKADRTSGVLATLAAGTFAFLVPPAVHAQQPEANQATVRALQERIERLERRLDALTRGQAAAAPPRETTRTAQAAPATAGASGRGAGAVGPGSFDVDEEAAQRALERTLTQAGALLLRPGAFTVTPGFSYTRNESTSGELAQIADPASGATSVVMLDRNLRRNEFAAHLGFKAGLPWESQFELDLPYNYVRASRVAALGPEDSGNGSGFGDASIGIAKTLLREKGALPDLIGRLTYNTGSGRRFDGRVSLPGGYSGLSAELVALKRQDPLAFFGGLSFTDFREEGGVNPGNLATLSFGTVLAASPSTSLQFGFTQAHRQRQALGGVSQAGTDRTYGVVSIGASSVLSRDVMLITSVGIGVGSESPEYSVNFSLPIRFR